tara:strand:- start:2985 stop:3587 length:603 start_codon:yes stop_codon:yes gene_type:complete
MESLIEIARQVSNCTDCPLNETRTNTVPGEGPETATIMIIGEAPGQNEDQQGRPFVGAAGKLLDQLLRSIDMKREEVFITNTLKCRPINNRDPLINESAACKKYLDRQIDLISPRIVITLGRYALSAFMPNAKIGNVRGTIQSVDDKLVFPIYHPAAALHQNRFRQIISEDIQKLPTLLASLGDTLPEYPESKSHQLSMF